MTVHHFSIDLCCLRLVHKWLMPAGRKLYQSQIAKHLGFSTSKTSELLSAMEKKGLIKKDPRKGKTSNTGEVIRAALMQRRYVGLQFTEKKIVCLGNPCRKK